ncbi:MAG: endolytic transglycosylase MltG, partial [Betaproteobacteria bacterium]|nr:endolytic transglycosylase MltG [Betaproteobacteria bacterium]
MRTIKRLLLVVLLLAVLLASVIGYYVVRPLTFPVLPLEFSLNQGSSLKTAARQMQQAGALPNDWMFVWLARMLGKSAQIHAGNYELETAVTMLELLAIVTEGQAAQSKFSIIEGWTFNQFRAALNTNPAIRHDSASL